MASIKDFVPPIVLETLRNERARTYSDYAAAAAACAGQGYEQARLVEVVRRKTEDYRDRMSLAGSMAVDAVVARNLLAIQSAARGGGVTVLDFGGACGTHYFQARSFFRGDLALRWHVVETPAMAAAGRATFADGALAFHDDLASAVAAAGELDLVFSSSCLQYMPNPYDTLAQLVACRGRMLYVTRVAVSPDDHDLVIVQRSRLSANGPGPMPAELGDGEARYPVTFPVRDRLEATVTESYEIRLAFDELKQAHRIGGRSLPGIGFLAQQRAR